MKTIQEKAKEYALKRYPITDPYDAHLPIADERGNVEEAFINGAYFGYGLAIRKLIDFKNDDVDNPEDETLLINIRCSACGGNGYTINHCADDAMETCRNCHGTGYIAI